MTKDSAQARTLSRVLLVSKKTTYQLQVVENHDPVTARLIAAGDPSVSYMLPAHTQHTAALEAVTALLAQRAITVQAVCRSELHKHLSAGDLVISVGGDGTFLDSSHDLVDVPILGVNSAPATSHGHYCLVTKDSLAAALDDIAAGKRSPLPLMRLCVYLNGQPIYDHLLNEVLFSHCEKQSTSRYLVELDGKLEEHVSSGIFVGPAAGSTGWVRSAGGFVLAASARQFHYMTREACIPPDKQWDKRRIFDESQQLRIISKMTAADLVIDGQVQTITVNRGDELVIKPSTHDLLAYLDAGANDRYM